MKYQDKKHHAKFKRRWKKLHGHVSYEEALKDHKIPLRWLGEINLKAQGSLEESNFETLTVIKLNGGSLLRETMWSSNPIESIFDKVRSKSMRVKSWNSGVDQIARWLATLLLDAESKFRTLKGYQEIPVLVKELKKLNLQTELEVASGGDRFGIQTNSSEDTDILKFGSHYGLWLRHRNIWSEKLDCSKQ